MNPDIVPGSDPTLPVHGIESPYRVGGYCLRHISWPAIFAGVVAAMALQVLFMLLGAALGFAVFTPLNDPNPMTNFAAGAAVVEGISAVFSLWFGGWVAGRFTSSIHSSACLHGFVVWCSATVLGVALVSGGAAVTFSGLSKVVGGGLSMAGKPLSGMAEHAADAAKSATQHSNATISSFVDEASNSQPAGATPAANIRAKRNIGLALARLFDPSQKSNMSDNHAAAVKTLVDDAGMSQADAEKTVTDWTASYERLQAQIAEAKEQAEAKAREAADQASKDLAVLSLCAFIALVIGAISASIGGCHGARAARLCDSRRTVA
jgi:hypothetical protein